MPDAGASVGVMAGGQTRGRFLGTGAAAIGGAALAGAWRAGEAHASDAAADSSAASSTAAAATAATTTYVEGAFGPGFGGASFILELDGAVTGFVKGVQGGEPFADVVTEKLGPDHIVHKHLAGVKYEDISISVGMGTSKGMYEWIKATLDKSFLRKNGSIVGCTPSLQEAVSGDFTSGLITEIGFPELNGSFDPTKMTVKLTPDYTRITARKGKAPITPPRIGKGTWKMEVDGIDATRVSKIESFTVKQAFDSSPAGQPQPVSLDIPNLSIWLLPNDKGLQGWINWFDDFVIQGNNGSDQERGGAIVFLNDKKLELARFTLQNLGPFKLTPEKIAGSEQVQRLKAELYCEDITFSYGPAAWA